MSFKIIIIARYEGRYVRMAYRGVQVEPDVEVVGGEVGVRYHQRHHIFGKKRVLEMIVRGYIVTH
jgi:hypothetical protein